MEGSKPTIDFSGWSYPTKLHIIHIVYQENYQSIPPYFMALGIVHIAMYFIVGLIKKI